MCNVVSSLRLERTKLLSWIEENPMVSLVQPMVGHRLIEIIIVVHRIYKSLFRFTSIRRSAWIEDNDERQRKKNGRNARSWIRWIRCHARNAVCIYSYTWTCCEWRCVHSAECWVRRTHGRHIAIEIHKILSFSFFGLFLPIFDFVVSRNIYYYYHHCECRHAFDSLLFIVCACPFTSTTDDRIYAHWKHTIVHLSCPCSFRLWSLFTFICLFGVKCSSLRFSIGDFFLSSGAVTYTDTHILASTKPNPNTILTNENWM